MTLEKSLASRMLAAHPDEAAAVLETLSEDDSLGVVSGAPPDTAAHLLSRLAPLRAARMLSRLQGSMAEKVASHLGLDEAADLVRRMPQGDRTLFLDSLSESLSGDISRLVAYPEGSAGSLMDTAVLALPTDVTAEDAIEQIRATPQSIRYNLYVVDRERVLVGVLNLRELLLADHASSLGSIARKEVLAISGHEDRRAILTHPAWREAHSLPVVDGRGVYLGAIRYRTWRRLQEEELQARSGHQSTTAEALGDLFSTGMVGLLGAFTTIAARPTGDGHGD